MEFDLAKYGTIGLESAFGALLTILPLEVVIDKLTFGRNIFKIKIDAIKPGNNACLSFFTVDNDWQFTKNHILSKSKNSAFLNCNMKGKAVGIYNQSKLILSN